MSYSSIALVDLSYLIARHYHARANDAGPNDAGEAVLGALARIRETVDHVVLCVDSPPYDRKKLYPEYKGTRKAPDHALIQISQWVRARVDADGYNVAAYVGQEGDDLVATLARVYAALCTDIRIYSSDKDIAQCVRDGVRMVVPGKGGHPQMLDVAGVVQRFGVIPEYMPLFLALMGDKGDNIPGVDKVGEKKAAEMANAAFGDRIKLGAHAVKRLDEMGDKAPVWLHNVVKALPDLPLWLDLTTLRTDVPVGAEKLLEKLERKPLVAEEFPLEDYDDLDAQCEVIDRTIEANDAKHAKARENVADVISAPPTWDEYNAKLDADRAKRDERHDKMAEQYETMPLPPPESAAPKVGGSGASTGSALPPTATGSTGEKTVPSKADDSSAGSVGSTSASSGTPPKAAAPPAASATAASTPVAASEPETRVVPRSEGPARIEAPSWSLALQPATARDAWPLAKTLYNSRYFSRYGNENGVFTAILLGRELGIGALAALQGLHIIKDRPFLSANLMRALAERHPDCGWIMLVEGDAERAVARTEHRKAGKLEYVYTRERAEQSGYFSGGNKDNWIKNTQEMLEARCISKAVRRWYPSAVMGMHDEQEAQDFE